MEDIQSILSWYGLTAEYIEDVSQKVRKVYTNHGIFALKALETSRNSRFTEQMIELEKKGYRHFVPIYRNREGDFLTEASTGFFYLMPWLALEKEVERDQKHEYLFKEIAYLHQKTEKKVEIRKEDTLQHYEQTRRKWEAEKLKYEEFVTAAEKEWYMSPFQLQAVMYYQETISACDFALDRLKDWQEVIKDQTSSRIVLNHGRLSVRHFLYNDTGNGYLTNFEKAGYAPPHHDLIVFYSRLFNMNPVMCRECVNWFYTYHQAYPLREEEISLLLSYLAYPGSMFTRLRYYHAEQSIREREGCVRLLKAYWKMKNAEPLVTNIYESEQNRKLQEETESPSP
ncbi:spore coat protein YsxE [Bacillus sp. CLL-7-23]|uniref:Spore coat protein YsxE n=1 Tax=Bacillus changyiensis TaxID=3004103 RepID=A0ABT4X5R4_9BACI|nr:spore coat protein YsxE [Bacillus changyiensis]MDA7027594.1 spore coat protein YsxE [Bacillus changyiensis]